MSSSSLVGRGTSSAVPSPGASQQPQRPLTLGSTLLTNMVPNQYTSSSGQRPTGSALSSIVQSGQAQPSQQSVSRGAQPSYSPYSLTPASSSIGAGGTSSTSSSIVLNATQGSATTQRQLAPARVKLDELFQYWLQRHDTAELLQRLASDATAELEGQRTVDADPDDEFEEPAEPAEDSAVGVVAVDAAPSSTVQPTSASPPNGVATNNPRRSGTTGPSGRPSGDLGMVNIAVSMEDLPTDLGGFSLGATKNVVAAAVVGSQPKTPKRITDEVPLSPGRAQHHTPPSRTPRDGTGKQQGLLGAVDEMDMAHRIGALSPRALSPSGPLMMSEPGTKSPFDINLRSPRISGFTLDHGPPKSRSPSPQANRGAAGAAGAATSSPPAACAAIDDSDRENTPRQTGLRRRSATSSLASSFSDIPVPARPPVATLADIPTFYFGRGRPTTLKATLMEDVAAGSGNAKPLAASTSSFSGLVKPPAQTSAITNPAEEREVAAMQRIIANMNNPAKRPAAGRLASASKGRPTTSSGAGATEASLLAAVRQLCTEAFGIPAVLAPIVLPRIVVKPSNTLTVASARGFYDQCYSRASETRRIFETLLGSSASAPATEKGSQLRRNYLVRDDFIPLLLALVEHHPGLTFLKEAADFQTKYVDTVILRVFYEIDVRDTGRISWEAFAHSTLPDAIKQLAMTDEINQVLAYFSYEHFYVLYCRFWELDTDKDVQISAADLARYFPEGTVNDVVIDRVVAGAGRKSTCKTKNRMNYDDFVFFCMAEEDKTTTRALTYWFRVLDADGDGILSGHELSTVYDLTRSRLEQLTGEAIAFPDVMSQLTDMLRGAPGGVSGAKGFGTPSQAMPAAAATISGLELMSRLRKNHLSRSASPATPNAVTPLQPTASAAKPPQASGGGANSRTTSSRGPGQSAALTSAWPAGESQSLPGFILADFLRRPQAAAVAISMLTNVGKFLQYEQKDPFVVNHERSQITERNDWDRFCRAEYDRMSLSEEDG